jgi:hypothetical protein
VVTSIEPVNSGEPIDAIGPHTVEVGPWRRRLIFYQRIAGGFMIFKGLTYWSTLIGFGDGSESYFQYQSLDTQAATIFFAVIDLIAGVALWLGSAWGATMWLVAAALQLLADMAIIEPSGLLVLLTMLEICLVAGYVVLRFMVHVESERRR